MRRKPAWPKLSRDIVLFVVGLGLIANESLRSGPERPYLLVLYAGMIGLPVFLRTDERRNSQQSTDADGDARG